MRFCVAVGWIFAVALFPAVGFRTDFEAFVREGHCSNLYERCAMCHRPGEVAPMSLMSYDEVRPWARAIKTKVVSRTMPPWYAEASTASGRTIAV